MMRLSIFFFSCLIAAGTALAQAPAARPARVIPTVTRTIQNFGMLENDWIDAVQRRDRDALKKIVADNFELRNAAAPGTPVPREESLGHALRVAPFQSSIEQMAAHEYGDIVVVSFLWKLAVPKKGTAPQKVFVVDTWKRHDGDWQVVTRYTAPVFDAAMIVPGAVPNTPTIEKKY